jgi:hypothetical protein
MLIYFELHFDDTGQYWVDNVGTTDNKISENDGFKIDYISGSNRDDYSVIFNLYNTNYNTGGELIKIIYEVKEDFLLKLRNKKINKIFQKENGKN